MEPRHLCDIIDRFLPELERAYKVLPYYDAEMQNDRDIAGWLECGIINGIADAEALRNINRSLSRMAQRLYDRRYNQ